MNSWHTQQLKFAFGIGGFMSFYGIVMGIVLFGDKVGINVPQKGVVIALVLLSIPFALLIGYVSSRRAKKKEEAAKAEAEAKAGEKAGEKTDAEKPAEKSAPTSADSGDFKQSAEEVVQFLKNSNLAGAGNAVYSLPWYLVAGTIKSGKSSLVIGSDLTFQNLPSQRQSELKVVRPTKAVDWRVTNDAVFVDTSGAFQAESEGASEWTALLDTIKKYRSNRPLDGFILTVSAEKILNSEDEREIEEMAKVLRAKLDEAMQKFKIRFPVYLVFTKADSIEGFRDSFSNSKQEGKNLVWGATIPLEKADNGQAMFDGEFELLQNSIMKRRLMRLSAPFPPVRQLRIFNFPLHFGSARRKLGAFVSTLFKPNPFSENPFLRGFYFTASPVANAKQGGVQTVGQTFFTEKLFRDVILRDKDLVRTFEEQRQKPPILGWLLTFLGILLTLAFLGLVAGSFFNNKALVADAGKKGEIVLDIYRNNANINPLQKKPDETETEIKAIDSLRKMLVKLDDYERNGAPWIGFSKERPILGWGLYSGNALYREKLLPIYFQVVEQRFKTPTVEKIKQDLKKFADSNPVANPAKLTAEEEKNLGETYDLLKAYLMLTGEYKARANEAEITNVLKKYWAKESRTPAGLEPVAEDILIFWARQIDRQEAPPVGFPRIPFDEDARTLVTAVRKKLQVFPAPNRYYKLKVTEISKTIDENVGAITVTGILARNNANTNFVEGKHQIPGAYTIEGFRLMKKAIDEADKKLSEDDWVMGEEGKKDVAAQSGGADRVQELYFRDYIDQWNNLIKDARVKPYEDGNKAKAALEEFSQKSSPVAIIIREVARNTDFTGKKTAASGGFFSGIIDTIKGWFSSKEDLGTGGNSDVEIAFRPVSNFVGEADAKDAPIGKYQNQITLVYNKFSKIVSENKVNDVSAEFAKSNFKNFTELGTGRDKIETELKPFSEPASAQVIADFLRQPLGNLSALLGAKGKDEITKLWSETILPKAQEAFKGFPFEDGATEANIKALEEFLNPTESGILTKFFNENLKNDFKESNGQFTPTVPDKYNEQFVAFLNNAFRLREKLFGKSSATIKYSYSFELKAPTDLTVTGTVDGEAIEVGKAKNINFPAGTSKEPGVNITFGTSETAATPTPAASPTSSPATSPTPAKSPTGIAPIEYKMQWGLFRLFKDGGASGSTSPYNLTFNRGDKKITIIITPLGGDVFEKNFEAFKAVRTMPQGILK